MCALQAVAARRAYGWQCTLQAVAGGGPVAEARAYR